MIKMLKQRRISALERKKRWIVSPNCEKSKSMTAKRQQKSKAERVRDALTEIAEGKLRKASKRAVRRAAREIEERESAEQRETAPEEQGLSKELSKEAPEMSRKARTRLAQSLGGSRARVRVWSKVVLESLRIMPNYTYAALKAGIARESLLDYRNRHPEYQAQCEKAMKQGAEVLEMHAWQRATQGVKKPVFGRDAKGNPVQVGEVTEFSDRLAEVMLKAHMREKYAPPQQTEISGPGGSTLAPIVAPTQVQIIIPDNGRDAITINEVKQIPESSETTTDNSQS